MLLDFHPQVAFLLPPLGCFFNSTLRVRFAFHPQGAFYFHLQGAFLFPTSGCFFTSNLRVFFFISTVRVLRSSLRYLKVRRYTIWIGWYLRFFRTWYRVGWPSFLRWAMWKLPWILCRRRSSPWTSFVDIADSAAGPLQMKILPRSSSVDVFDPAAGPFPMKVPSWILFRQWVDPAVALSRCRSYHESSARDLPTLLRPRPPTRTCNPPGLDFLYSNTPQIGQTSDWNNPRLQRGEFKITRNSTILYLWM